MRIIDFFDGFESDVQPTIEGIDASDLPFTPAGTIASDTIQGAIEEAASEAVQRIVSTDEAVPRFNGATGALQDSGVTIDDSNNMVVPGNLTVQGTTITVDTENLLVEDKLITVNNNGAAASGGGSGIEVEEDGVATGYVKTSVDRNSFNVKAPNTNGVASITPGASNDEVALLAKAQSLSGKTLTDELRLTEISTPATPSSGLRKVYPKSDGKLYHLGSDGVERAVGSGSGSGKNYLSDLFAGDATTGINQYADAAAASPVDGTGGSPAGLTTALETSSPLRGTSSQRFSKDASNRQGLGWSVDFTVDRADYEGARPLIIKFKYKTSANYASNDIRLFVYDKDGTTLLTVQDISNNSGNILASSNTSSFLGTFYPNSSNNDYRLIFHITSTNATAYDLDLIDLSVGPEQSVPGAIVVDLGTETWTDDQANATTSVKIQRVGNRVFVDGTVTYTGVQSGAFNLTIPTAYTPSDTAAGTINATKVALLDTGSVTHYGHMVLTSSSNIRIYAVSSASAYGDYTDLSATVPHTWASGDFIRFSADWQVSGWSASAALSSTEIMFSTAVARYSTNTAQSIGTGTDVIIDFEDRDYDNTGSVTTGASWKFTAPRAGKYRIAGFVTLASNAGWASTETCYTLVYKNGAYAATLNYTQARATGTWSFASGGVTTLSLAKGDYIDFRINQASGGSIALDGNALNNWVTVEEVPDFSIFSAITPVITQWTSFTPTGTFIANTTYTGKWRRVGQNMEIEYNLAFVGAPTSTTLQLNMPSGYTIDTSAMANAGPVSPLGYGTIWEYGVLINDVVVLYVSSTVIQPFAKTTSSSFATLAGITQVTPFTIGNADILAVRVSVPIVGW